MIETKTKTIDGLTFTSTQLPPLKAYPLSARVASILLPLLSKFDSLGLTSMDSDAFMELGASKVLPALEPLLELLAKKENEDLPQKLLQATTVDVPNEAGEMTRLTLISPDAINRAFQGRGLTMFKAMWFAVEVNFADFFGGAFKGALTKAPATTEANASG